MSERLKSGPGLRERKQVLIVDDSEDDAYLLRAGLASRGFEIDYLRVDTELDMAAALEAGGWDLVIADHDMPGFDAFAALEVLKRSGQDLPFVIHSGHISDRSAILAMHEGVADYVEKGNYDRLLPVIERELRGAEVRRAARQADDRIQELANFDDLSTLPNHKLFSRKLSDWLAESGLHGRNVRGALFILDVDRFLRINTSFGYQAGNEVLRELGRRLLGAVGQDAMLARLGGDEFGLFVPGLEEEGAVEAYVRWLMRLFDTPFQRPHVELYLTASVGIAQVPRDGEEVFELLMNAEAAKGVAKRAGGNQFRFYDPGMSSASVERLAMESDLRHAVERQELFLVYQPVVDATSEAVSSVEALLRWQHPRHGLVMPDRFIPLADETGLIVDIGAWVLREACRQGQAWRSAGYPELRMSVNVSAVQFAQPRLLQLVADALKESGFPSECLILEITESSLMQDVEATAGMLRALKNLQVGVSVDDFGTGYSSLSYLKRFPIDVIKIDKSFVRDLCEDEEDAAIVRAIIALAHSMRRRTLAEGVETEAQVEVLRRESCNLFQGHYFSKPLPAGDLLAFLEGARERENAANAERKLM